MRIRRAHPTWSMFAACDPEKPCITPGTYAFLGAAAGLAYASLALLVLHHLADPIFRRGITRITVTVVVIMFELTGALTYILPTMVRSLCASSFRVAIDERAQIVVMVTKAVSDQFGKGGIADQMIRFNGFPFLENDDNAFNVSGALTSVLLLKTILMFS